MSFTDCICDYFAKTPSELFFAYWKTAGPDYCAFDLVYDFEYLSVFCYITNANFIYIFPFLWCLWVVILHAWQTSMISTKLQDNQKSPHESGYKISFMDVALVHAVSILPIFVFMCLFDWRYWVVFSYSALVVNLIFFVLTAVGRLLGMYNGNFLLFMKGLLPYIVLLILSFICCVNATCLVELDPENSESTVDFDEAVTVFDPSVLTTHLYVFYVVSLLVFVGLLVTVLSNSRRFDYLLQSQEIMHDLEKGADLESNKLGWFLEGILYRCSVPVYPYSVLLVSLGLFFKVHIG